MLAIDKGAPRAGTNCSESAFAFRNLKELKKTLVKAVHHLDRKAVADGFDPISLPLPNAHGQRLT